MDIRSRLESRQKSCSHRCRYCFAHPGPSPAVGATSSEVCRVREHRIDDQRFLPVILIDTESNSLRATQLKATRHFLFLAVRHLIDPWGFNLEFLAETLDFQFSLAAYLKALRTVELHLNQARIDPRLDTKIEFKLTLVAVIDQIDPGIHIRIARLAIISDIRVPLRGLVADKIVGPSG